MTPLGRSGTHILTHVRLSEERGLAHRQKLVKLNMAMTTQPPRRKPRSWACFTPGNLVGLAILIAWLLAGG